MIFPNLDVIRVMSDGSLTDVSDDTIDIADKRVDPVEIEPPKESGKSLVMICLIRATSKIGTPSCRLTMGIRNIP